MKKVIIILFSVLLFIDACSTLKLAEQLKEEKAELELSRQRMLLKCEREHIMVVPQLKSQNSLFGPQKKLVISYSGNTDNGLVMISRYSDPEIVLGKQPAKNSIMPSAGSSIAEYIE